MLVFLAPMVRNSDPVLQPFVSYRKPKRTMSLCRTYLAEASTSLADPCRASEKTSAHQHARTPLHARQVRSP